MSGMKTSKIFWQAGQKKSNSNVTYSTTEYAKKCQPSGIVEPHLLSEREPAFFSFLSSTTNANDIVIDAMHSDGIYNYSKYHEILTTLFPGENPHTMLIKTIKVYSICHLFSSLPLSVLL